MLQLGKGHSRVPVRTKLHARCTPIANDLLTKVSLTSKVRWETGNKGKLDSEGRLEVVKVYKILNGEENGNRDLLSTFSYNTRTRGHYMKLVGSKF